MADPKRRRNRLLGIAAVATTCVIGPVVTVLLCLGSVTSFAAYMDVHGAAVAMRLAAFGAIAVVVVTIGACVISAVCERADAKKDKDELAALRYGAHARAPQASPRDRHRKVA